MTHVPRPGDFGVQPGRGWAEWLVRLGTFSRYGHAAVVVEVVSATDLLGPAVTGSPGYHVQVVEAAPRGARRRWVGPADFTWSRCPLTDTQRAEVVAAAVASVGVPYDWWAILAFVPRFWRARSRGWSPDHSDARLICSELVAWAYRRAGHEVAPAVTVAPGDVSPGDLAQHCLLEAEGAL